MGTEQRRRRRNIIYGRKKEGKFKEDMEKVRLRRKNKKEKGKNWGGGGVMPHTATANREKKF